MTHGTHDRFNPWRKSKHKCTKANWNMEVDECVKESAFDGKLPDEEILKKLTVPVPKDEKYRLKVLRETALLDSDLSDPSFDRFTALCQRIFNVD